MRVATQVRLGAAIVMAAALAACGSSNSSKTATSPSGGPKPGASSAAPQTFSESFDNNDNGWPTTTSSDGTKLAVANGEYSLTLPVGTIRYIRPAALADRKDLMSGVHMTAKVQIREGTQYAFGLACRMSPRDKQYYVARFFDDGTSTIIRREKGGQDRVLHASSSPMTVPTGQPIQLDFTCGEKSGAMTFAFKVNGQQTVTADDKNPLPDNPPGIYAVAGLKTVTSTLVFDDLQISPYTP